MGENKEIKVIKEKKSEHVPFGFKVSKDVISIDESCSIFEAANVLQENKIGAIIVKSGANMVGIISERDIVYRAVAQNRGYKDTLVRDIMTKAVETVNLEDGLDVIHEKLKNLPFRHLPVKKGNKVVCMISNRDLMYLKGLKMVYSPKKGKSKQ